MKHSKYTSSALSLTVDTNLTNKLIKPVTPITYSIKYEITRKTRNSMMRQNADSRSIIVNSK